MRYTLLFIAYNLFALIARVTTTRSVRLSWLSLARTENLSPLEKLKKFVSYHYLIRSVYFLPAQLRERADALKRQNNEQDLESINPQVLKLYETKKGMPYGTFMTESGEGKWKTGAHFLYELFDELIRKKPHAHITHAFSIGCSAGYAEHSLSQRQPGLNIVGLDINRDVIDFAQRQFGSAKLQFIYGYPLDILRAAELPQIRQLRQNAGTAVLLLCNTATFFYRGELIKYLAAAKKAQCRYIILSENFFPDLEAFRLYRFDRDTQSRRITPQMWVHNYPLLLKEAGYTILAQRIFRFIHPTKDVQSASHRPNVYKINLIAVDETPAITETQSAHHGDTLHV